MPGSMSSDRPSSARTGGAAAAAGVGLDQVVGAQARRIGMRTCGAPSRGMESGAACAYRGSAPRDGPRAVSARVFGPLLGVAAPGRGSLSDLAAGRRGCGGIARASSPRWPTGSAKICSQGTPSARSSCMRRQTLVPAKRLGARCRPTSAVTNSSSAAACAWRKPALDGEELGQPHLARPRRTRVQRRASSMRSCSAALARAAGPPRPAAGRASATARPRGRCSRAPAWTAARRASPRTPPGRPSVIS